MMNFPEFDCNASTTNRTLDTGIVHMCIAMSTISIVGILLGFPGNILIVHGVMCCKQMQKAQNYFIQSLAFFDSVALLISVPFATLNRGHYLRYMPNVVCKTLMPTSSIVVVVSVYTHVAIALERRRAIVFPLLPKPSPKRIKTFIANIWLVPTLIIALLYYHFSKVSFGYFCTLSFSILSGQQEAYLRAFVITTIVSTLSLSQYLNMVISTDYSHVETKYCFY